MPRLVLAVALTALGLILPAFAGFRCASGNAEAADLTIDGVPLPGNVAPLDRVPPGVPVDRRFAGTWVGAWGGDLKTILTFESIEADGTATAIYAVGDHALWGIKRGWWRFSGRIEGNKLRIKGRITEITYELAPSGRLLATYARRNQRSRAVLTRQKPRLRCASRAQPCRGSPANAAFSKPAWSKTASRSGSRRSSSGRPARAPSRSPSSTTARPAGATIRGSSRRPISGPSWRSS